MKRTGVIWQCKGNHMREQGRHVKVTTVGPKLCSYMTPKPSCVLHQLQRGVRMSSPALFSRGQRGNREGASVSFSRLGIRAPALTDVGLPRPPLLRMWGDSGNPRLVPQWICWRHAVTLHTGHVQISECASGFVTLAVLFLCHHINASEGTVVILELGARVSTMAKEVLFFSSYKSVIVLRPFPFFPKDRHYLT